MGDGTEETVTLKETPIRKPTSVGRAQQLTIDVEVVDEMAVQLVVDGPNGDLIHIGLI